MQTEHMIIMKNFQYLSNKNIEAAIKLMKNSSYDRSIAIQESCTEAAEEF
ncbi:MAG: hypothetical protein WAM14_07805 [Candidatus Nitrosopolaris sp.]